MPPRASGRSSSYRPSARVMREHHSAVDPDESALQTAVVRLLVCLAALVLAPAIAVAAPRADVVVLWAPGVAPEPIAAAARDGGAALIDRTPPRPPAPPAIDASIRRGIDAYEALRFDDAWAALSEARTAADAHGGAGLTPSTLSDLFLYRGLTQIQRGEPAAAWDELVTAAAVAPIRVLDPARFAPRVLEDVERARGAALGRPRVELAITAPVGCAVVLDGVTLAAPPLEAAAVTATVIVGPHWIHATCAADVRWGARIEASAPSTPVTIAPATPVPPTDDEVLIQARAAGARAALTIVTRGSVATVRLLAIDGRERERRVVATDALPSTVAAMLRPPPASRWYRSRWAWAAGAAALAAAIAIPITAAVVGDAGPAAVTIRGPGALP